MVTKIAGEFKTKPVEGMLSHQLKQNVINGDKTIIQNPNEGQRKEHDKCDFDKHEVYGLDVLISSGEGTVCDWSGKAGMLMLTLMGVSFSQLT